MKPKILFTRNDWAQNEYRKKHDLWGGIGYYRVVKPLEYLSEWFDIDHVGKDIKKFGFNAEEQWTNIFKKYDLVWVKPINNPGVMSMIFFLADHFKKRVVMDFDDNYFEVKPDQPAYEHFKPGTRNTAFLGAAISLSDALSVSTNPLANYYSERNNKAHGERKKTFVLPNCIDDKEFQFTPVPKLDDRITIGWAGSNTHFADLKVVMPVLAELMKKYPNLYLEFMGGVGEDEVGKLFFQYDFTEEALDRVAIIGGTRGFDKYPEHLSKRPWDIGIAPLVDDAFTRAKSHIKWMEYAMFKIPIVASKVYPYCTPIQGVKTIDQGVTGYLCKNDKQWKDKLTKLIEDKDLREKIGNNAYEYVLENWHIKKHAYKWRDAINEVLNADPVNKQPS